MSDFFVEDENFLELFHTFYFYVKICVRQHTVSVS